MSPAPRITKITSLDSIRLNVYLENLGDAVLGPGYLFGRKTFKDGSVSDLRTFAYTDLNPGETTKVFINGLSNCKSIEIRGYRVGNTEKYGVSAVISRGFFGWKLK